MICLWSGLPGFNFCTSAAPAFQSWFAVEYSSCFISVMNLIYMFAGLIHWSVEVLHEDRTTSMCIYEPQQNTGRGCCSMKPVKAPLPIRPPPPPQYTVIYYWPSQCDASVVVCSDCQCSSALWLSFTYCSSYLGYPCGNLLGKSCHLGASLVLFLF